MIILDEKEEKEKGDEQKALRSGEKWREEQKALRSGEQSSYAGKCPLHQCMLASPAATDASQRTSEMCPTSQRENCLPSEGRERLKPEKLVGRSSPTDGKIWLRIIVY